MSIHKTVVSGLVALAATAAAAIGAATPAQAAVDPATVVAAVKGAYEAYQKLSSNQLTLQQATTQIITKLESIETHIIGHIDLIAAADVEACALSAVTNVADLPNMSFDTKQLFAFNTTDCVSKAKALLNNSTSKVAIDHIGYALNTVGPIALVARKHAGLSVGTLRTNIIGATNTLISKLTPPCTASPLWGDAEPGGPVEVILRCTAFNGKIGGDSVIVFISRNDPLPPFDYSRARTAAMRGTSYELGVAALPILNQSS
ncbi:hypothetical protein [Allorhizocola rhizosphaerae]|uniref:hypothetical protein n=1 Tax=Allorhizocola rhizosphaerae TaxID=1872709 RepID=UPI000E3C58CA|nr:hypothetical protein [Allorhizocola rhizosphaerae]